ncbi:hypothetical protein CABS01_15282 [Colletotrichum abscissum]|uniref:Uncharacterized protein n=2 Tax=Colletotrichum acutatum species complex TaxID=2707335 RepID=A0A9P9XSB8_9PEZI|nr:uncharacterized protein CABS01_15282 [Colletotrichum abscissum]KAI3559481.1 hypothetical protein CABS02_00456 [Colletotrichum abscissum]KAK0369083.1 hypothetical protein CLIM01_13564 [Colletotrichum limetticola]KAK1476747.1 hypothetical protein CABS01_15282 [Colletotrichum abscissum]
MADSTLILQRVSRAGIPHITFHTSALGEWEFGITRDSHGFSSFTHTSSHWRWESEAASSLAVWPDNTVVSGVRTSARKGNHRTLNRHCSLALTEFFLIRLGGLSGDGNGRTWPSVEHEG